MSTKKNGLLGVILLRLKSIVCPDNSESTNAPTTGQAVKNTEETTSARKVANAPYRRPYPKAPSSIYGTPYYNLPSQQQAPVIPGPKNPGVTQQKPTAQAIDLEETYREYLQGEVMGVRADIKPCDDLPKKPTEQSKKSKKRCPRCNRDLNSNRFKPSTKYEDGLTKWCQECLLAPKDTRYKKYCPKCKKVRLKTSFKPNTKRWDNLTLWCQHCLPPQKKSN